MSISHIYIYMYVYAVLFGCVQCRSRLGAHLVVGPTYWDFGALKYLSGPDLPTKFRACLIILTLTRKKKVQSICGPCPFRWVQIPWIWCN
eukprot:TRINITY_DN9429_c4_g1_i1.p1 TRINITY_DN9429_c4_g1~~TRINITY_DN9429_c4_g1_i1.p1  ORF type:complete len:103 (+),score=0.72 TRINITY_DN9429_c4_g1_i1:42-311(+)